MKRKEKIKKSIGRECKKKQRNEKEGMGRKQRKGKEIEKGKKRHEIKGKGRKVKESE
jgi:hypothetical protein